MKFTSISDKNLSVNFETALFDGLAPDGGLFMPESIPEFSVQERNKLSDSNFHEAAKLTLRKWLGDQIPSSDLDKIVSRALNFDIPIVDVGSFKVMELFHGPTMAFKDVAARFLAV